jgi:Viral BACON domain
VRKLKHLTEVLALAALVLLGHPDTLSAQTLTFSPNPIAFPITGPGQVTNAVVTFTSSTIAITSIQIPAINSIPLSANWLNATVTGSNTMNVIIQNTSSLSNNTTYNGTIHVQANGNSATDTIVPVALVIGNTGGGLLVASPSSVSFVQSAPGAGLSQTITLSVNGSQVPAFSTNFAASLGGVVFVNTSVNTLSNGTVTLTVNNAATTAGTYTGNLTIYTQNYGAIGVPVTLTIGGASSGLAANPNPVSFNVQTGGTAPSQNVNITANGAPVSISSVSATSTPTGWLLPSNPFTTGVVNVGVNAALLTSGGTYTGTVTVNTTQGTLTFQVNLTVGGIPTLQVNPTTVNFAYQAGTTVPLAQTITVTSNGNPVSFTITPQIFTGNSQWLVVSPSGTSAVTPSTITVNVSPGTLAAGLTYTGNIQLNTFGGSTNPTINIPVNLLVSNNPILNASPASLSFTAQVGSNPLPQTLTLGSSSTSLSYSVTSSVVTPAAGNWLQIPSQFGATPGTVNVTVNTQGLAVGTYTGNINVSSPTAGNGSSTVPVTLTITAGSALQLNTNSLNFAYQIGQLQPLNQAVAVSTTSGQLGFTVSSQVNSGLTGWLLPVQTISGTAPGNFIAGVNTSGLAAGTYTGTFTVTPSGSTVPQTVQVTLVVSDKALFVISPDAIAFTAPLGGGSSTPSFQSVAVTSTDGTPIAFTAVATSTGGWLIVSPPTGQTNSNLTITTNPNGLAVGTYFGTVAVTSTSPAGVANSPRNIAVTLNIEPTATLAVSANSLSFTQSTSGGAPASQTLSVSSVGTAVTFNAIASTSQGLSWLAVSPINATTSPGAPVTLTVSVNGSGLPANALPYTGTILITSPGSANTQTVTVSLTISNQPTIVMSPTALASASFQIGASANPPQQTISVSLLAGGTASFTTSATMANGTGWLAATTATGVTPGTVIVTITPGGLPAGHTTARSRSR